MAEQEVVAPAPVVPAVETPKAPAVKERMFEIVNGKGEKTQIPESALIERYKKSEGLEGRVQNAAKLETAFNNFVAQATNPQELLSLLQGTLKYDDEKQEALIKAIMKTRNPRIMNAIKKGIFDEEFDAETATPLTPEQKRVRDLEEYKANQEAKQKALDEEGKKKSDQEAVEKFWNDYRVKIGAELTTQGIPQKEAIVSRVARYALLYRQAGKEVDFKDCVSRVKTDLMSEYQDFTKDATEDNILDRLPEGMAELVNKALLKRLKAKEKERSVPKSDAPRKSVEDSSFEKRKETKDWLRDAIRRAS